MTQTKRDGVMVLVSLALAGGMLSGVGAQWAWPLVWLAPLLLLLSLHRCSGFISIWAGFAYGVGEALPCFAAISYGLAMPLIIAGTNAAEWAALAVSVKICLRLKTLSFRLIAIGLVTALWSELVPWRALGLGWDLGSSSIGLAMVRVIGVVGVSVVLMMCACIMLTRQSRHYLRGAAVMIVIGIVVAGTWLPPRSAGAPFRVRLVQGQVPNWAYAQALWVPAVEREIERRYRASLDPPARKADLLVWPETAIRPSPQRSDALERELKRAAVQTEQAIIAGLPVGAPPQQLNQAYVIDKHGRRVGSVAKTSPLPFAENELSAGPMGEVMSIGSRRIGILICSDSLRRSHV